MKKFTQKFRSHTLHYVLFACLVAAVAFFAILPLIPDAEQQVQGPSLTASIVAAFGGDGGGDGGGGGDAGDGCCGDAGDSGDTAAGPSEAPQMTTCSITSNPSTIGAGQSTTITWSVANATSVSINNGIGAVGASGSQVVTPTLSTDYVVTAIGPNGQATCSTFVTVIPPVAVCTISATRGSITAGESVTLSWNTSNAYRVIIDNGVGSVAPNGSHTVSPTVTTTYTLTAYDALGINIVCVCTITIEVIPVPPPAPTCTLNATPTSITRGQSVALNWSTTNASSVSINNGIGAVGGSGSQSVSPINTTTYTLTAIGSGGNINCPITVTVTEPPVPAPTCTLTANPTTINPGQSSTLTWSTTNAASVSLNQNIGTVGASGSQSVSPTQSTTYTLTTIGNNGQTINCVGTVTVINTPPPAPTCTLTANPTTINPGQSSTLTWSTTNVSNASMNQNIGTTTVNGSRSVSPTTTTTYTLTAIGNNGSVITCVSTIVVEVPPVPNPVRCDAFSASPSTLTNVGTTTLQWVTTGATSVAINTGVGTVSASGTKAVSVGTTTTYTLTAQGENGPVTCQTTVTIAPVTIVPTCDAFSVSPTSVSRGATATLNWNTTNASSVSINNGVGAVSVDGSRAVTVSNNTTYTLTATNGSATDTCQATVTIRSSGGGGSSAPRCTLTASKKTIQAGEAVTLSWKNTNTNDVLLKDSNGKTLADSKKNSSIDEDEDSFVVRPTNSTSYTLTAIRSSQTRECTVDINVTNAVTVSSVRSQTPLVAGISLASVPYTGFDAGPFLTFLFYTLLLVWGLGVAYMLVVKRGPVLGFSLSETTRFANRPVIREHLTQAPPAPNSAVVREQIFGSAYVPAPRTAYTPLMASPTSVVGYGSLYNDSYRAEAVAPTVTAPVAEVTTAYQVDEQPMPSYEMAPARDDVTDIAYLEARATDKQVLISSDALHFILAQSTIAIERIEVLDMIIDVAKATYPAEDGWIVVNKARILSLLK